MDPHLSIILTLAIGFALASFFGFLAQKLNLPNILGYLLAGYLIGPYSPGFVANMELSEQLAEVGVVLMLFGVGMHFKLEDLFKVKSIAVPGAILQTLAATFFTTLIIHHLLDWPILECIILGLSIGVASTVVLVRVLSDKNLLNTLEGYIAIGWLVVEDILTVIILVLLPTLAVLENAEVSGTYQIASHVSLVILKFMLLAAFMFTWGHKIVVYILTNVARLRSQELLTLTILAIVFVIALGSVLLFGMSIALGAFIAGMVIGKTNLRHQAAANSLPLKDIFAILFFLSIGMLFNPEAMIQHPTLFLSLFFVILVIKPLAAYSIMKAYGYSFKSSLTVALSLAQIGEFSFILAEQAMKLKILPDEGFDLLVACSILSISINPLLIDCVDKLDSFLKKKGIINYKSNQNPLSVKPEKEKTKILIVGVGPIGKTIADMVKSYGYTSVIIESNIDTVSRLEEEAPIIYGDASQPEILKDAHIQEAKLLIITIPDTHKTMEIIEAAKRENPEIEIVSRVRYIAEKPLVQQENIHLVCTEEEALKSFAALTKHILHTNHKRIL